MPLGEAVTEFREKRGETTQMMEMINHATVHKELLHDTVNQDAFVYDQADFPTGK